MILAICDTCGERRVMEWKNGEFVLSKEWLITETIELYKSKFKGIFCSEECRENFKPLPEGCVPMVGQTVDDPESPLDGKPIMDFVAPGKLLKRIGK